MKTAFAKTQHDANDSYGVYLDTLSLPRESLFIVEADLWHIYLDNFDNAIDRQRHDCRTCRRFIERFGRLVTINPKTGKTKSAIWDHEKAPSKYRASIAAMQKAVESAEVAGVFLSSESCLGTPVTGEWTHFAVENTRIYKNKLLTDGQAQAKKKGDYKNVSRAIGELNITDLQQIVELLDSDALYRSEKVLGQAKWLLDLKLATDSIGGAGNKRMQKRNIIWKAVSDAPDGFCHPRSSMIGTILDDMESGFCFDDIARRFKEKMDHLQYQRPSAMPKSANIKEAEDIVNKLGVKLSLERRFATIDDMRTIWRPSNRSEDKEGEGVFKHLLGCTNQRRDDVVNSGKITWHKFAKYVLQKARRIEIEVPRGLSDFIVFLSALYIDSPVIFQWGNHVSWYRVTGGSLAIDYSLEPGWFNVNAVCFPPYMWGDDLQAYSRSGNDAIFIIDGARETRNNLGNAIFPETLRSEFHSIRKVIEAHSLRSLIHQVNEPQVIGKGIGCKVRVHTSIVTEYHIDRYD